MLTVLSITFSGVILSTFFTLISIAFRAAFQFNSTHFWEFMLGNEEITFSWQENLKISDG